MGFSVYIPQVNQNLKTTAAPKRSFGKLSVFKCRCLDNDEDRTENKENFPVSRSYPHSLATVFGRSESGIWLFLSKLFLRGIPHLGMGMRNSWTHSESFWEFVGKKLKCVWELFRKQKSLVGERLLYFTSWFRKCRLSLRSLYKWT